jgi:hypothetical protein
MRQRQHRVAVSLPHQRRHLRRVLSLKLRKIVWAAIGQSDVGISCAFLTCPLQHMPIDARKVDASVGILSCALLPPRSIGIASHPLTAPSGIRCALGLSGSD